MFKSGLKIGKNSRGFTTVEMVMVVAILAVLLALIAPNVAQSWKKLKIAELDSTARQIFLTAQNELIDAKTSGKLQGMALDSSVIKTEIVTGQVTKTLYYISSETLGDSLKGLSALLATLPGEFVLYLSPYTGDVTDVYYSKSELPHSEVVELRTQLGETDNRELRGDLGIGYYGGLSSASREPKEDEEAHLPETLELINGEDLYLKLVYPQLGEGFISPDQILAEITLQDEEGHTIILKADGDSAADTKTPATCIFAGTISNNDYVLYVLLDSMVEGRSFPEMFPSLTAGDDINVTVSLSYNGKLLYENAPVGRVNSLFSAKYMEDKTIGGISHKKGIEFSRARHLSNLRHYSAGAASAVQMQDIDFTPVERKKTMLPVSVHQAEAPEFFPPVELTNGLKQNGIIIDGKGSAEKPYILHHFSVDSRNGAIFGNSAIRATFKNLRLLDPQIRGQERTGGLIGSLSSNQGNITIENCGVYRTPVSAGSSVPGVGFVEGGRNSDGANRPTGGLIGSIETGIGNSVLIKDSFGAILVSNGENQTGGLIGHISGPAPVTIENSYASGSVTSGTTEAYKQEAGGLVGSSAGTVNITDSFSSSNVFASNFGGSLVGSNTGTVTVVRSYACGIVTKNSMASYGPLVAGSGTVTYTNSRYLSQSGNLAVPDGYGASAPSGITPLEYNDLAKNADGSLIENSIARSFPYTASLLGKAYPFPMVREDYYGNWPERIGLQLPAGPKPYGLCYFEEYTDGSWGFYGYELVTDPVGGAEVRKMADSLDYVNSKTIVQASYGVLVPDSTPASEVKAPSFEWGGSTALKPRILLTAYGQHLYPLENITSLVTHANQLDRRVIDHQSGEIFYINPFFGGAISTEVLKIGPKGPANPNPLQIRTEGHLRSRGTITDSNWYYWQSHDIEVTQATTGGYTNNSGCTYDAKNYATGGNNTIYNLRRPLYETNHGLIKDLNLARVNINQPSDVAALAVENPTSSSDIINCHVLSGSIVSSRGNAAGLTWKLSSGKITNSTVGKEGGPPIIIRSEGNNQQVAGLVGIIGYTELNIQNCKVVNAQIESTGSNGTAAGFAAENAGTIRNGLVAADVGVTGSKATGFVGVNQWGKTITGCSTAATITSGGQGATGLIYTNHGEITLSYATGAVIAQNGGNASGFVYTMDGGTIEFSYYTGSVSAFGSGNASGFCHDLKQGRIANSFAVGSAGVQNGLASGFAATVDWWNGYVEYCYAAVSLTTTGNGSRQVGFIDTNNAEKITESYWLQGTGFNAGVSSPTYGGKVAVVPFATLRALNLTAAAGWTWGSGPTNWTLTTTSVQTHPVSPDLAGKAYPFPRIAGLDYYGDWPVE